MNVKKGSQSFIRQNVTFECGTPEYNLWSFSFVLPMVLIIAVIIPAVVAIQIYRFKDNLMARKKYTFMNGEYKPMTWFWEFIKMYVKLMIMICLTFYENNVPNKVNF